MADAGVFKSILFLVDGSESHRQAAQAAVDLAVVNGATLAAAAVVDTDTLKQLLSSRIFVADEMQEYETELEVSGRRQLRFVSKLAAESGLEIKEVLVKGAIHSAVLAQQKALGSELVIMAAFKSTARRDLLAHEKQRVLDACPVPVLLVR